MSRKAVANPPLAPNAPLGFRHNPERHRSFAQKTLLPSEHAPEGNRQSNCRSEADKVTKCGMLSSRSWKGTIWWKYFHRITERSQLLRPKLYVPYAEAASYRRSVNQLLTSAVRESARCVPWEPGAGDRPGHPVAFSNDRPYRVRPAARQRLIASVSSVLLR
jgi:hypothetical protein